jgi:protein-disulfide isomerase
MPPADVIRSLTIAMIKRAVVLSLATLLWACQGKSGPSSEATPAATTAANAAGKAATTDPLLTRADKARIMGSDSAKLWLVESSDFQCPYCRQWHDETWEQVNKEYVATGKVRFAFINHPMPFHPFAIPAAEAAMCAAEQDKFWPMHDALYATQDNWTKKPAAPVFDSLATAFKLDMTAWRNCVSTHHTRPMIDSDLMRSKQGGVNGTPSFFIGQQMAMEGAQPFSQFKKALDSALAKAGSK